MASRTLTGITTQTLVLNVTEGLYVLRYLGGANPRSAPAAIVKLSSAASTDADIITAPGLNSGEMPGPGSNVVILVRRSGPIEVVVEASGGNDSLDARFSLDLLAPALSKKRPDTEGRTQVKSDAMAKPDVSAPASGQSALIELFAHVARRGDIAADQEGWVAGPNAPSAIEGIEVSCNRTDLGVAIQYKNLANANRWSDWQPPGGFVGTRQKASPLTGLRLKVVGAASQGYELEGEALFLGSPIQLGRGQDLEFVSVGGLDPLVGLKLRLVQLSTTTTIPDVRKAPRVRVFRSYAD